jgi:hypothetical protein
VRRRGTTLIELLVASCIGLLLLFLLGTCWSVASRAWSQADQLGNTQRDALTLSYRLRHDYSNALVKSLVITPTLISFISDDVLTWNSTGSPQWSHWVQYLYTPSAGTVQRRSSPLSGGATTTVPSPLSPPAWGSGSSQLLASSVTMFAVSSQGGGPTLQISLRTQVNSSSQRVDLGLLPQLYGLD